MIKLLLEISMIGCGIIVIIAGVMGAREWLIIQKISNLSLSQLPVSKTIFCNLAIEWCHSNISHPKCIKPNLRLSYYPHKTRGGVYYSSSHECVIYVNSHDNIKQVTNTVIHEYVHARQKDKKFDKLYSQYHKELGYEQNPFELEAREVSKKHENECLLWVYNKIYSN